MNIQLSGKMAILFARVWGVFAILFGVFLIITIVDTVIRQGMGSDLITSILVRLVFAILFIFVGRIFLTMKMSVK